MAKITTNKAVASKVPGPRQSPTAGPVNRSRFSKELNAAVLRFGYEKTYALVCVLVLAGTTLLWTVLGAKLQQSNADQLVNPYLFRDSHTLHDAVVPGTHSFLLKWPLFYLIKLLGYSNFSFIAVTVLSVMATIAILAFVLYRIERRPLVFGTICLALASTLLLIPVQPYAGGLLPVNMAMLATRNLEYAAYILAIMLFIRSAGTRSRWFWSAAVILGVLVASDKLFLGLSVVGGLVGLIIYSLKRRWDTVTLSSNWLAVSLVGAVLGISFLALINASGFTHISSSSNGAPYSAVNSSRGLVLGALYAGMGLLTNFGANPAYDATIVRNIPHQFLSRIFSLAGPAYIINMIILCLGIFGVYHLVRASLAAKKSSRLVLDQHTSLALLLVLSSAAAFSLFIASDHYYAVDARYLTITLFSLFVCGALFTRNRNWRSKNIATAALIILAGIILGTISAVRTNNIQARALADTKARDLAVAQILNRHPVSVLVGDYWRVIPIKAAAGDDLEVMPLAGCFAPKDILSSKAWQPNLANHSFAYLLSLDRSLTDYRSCTLNQVISRYGRPNTSALIAGSLSHPKELLMFYDRGIHKSSPKITLRTPSTILPIALDELPYTTCPVPTIMNVVAHQDDDLLFMSPDLVHDVKAGHCIRTIYITAGDAGAGQFYWLSRQQGAEAAYSKMIGTDDIWIDRIVKVSDQEFITVANPRGNSKVSLIFVHLPDGKLRGEGFATTRFESLAKLDGGNIKTMHAVDGQSEYTANNLVSLLSSLMHVYEPTEVRTQSNYTSRQSNDHSDHMAVGRFAKKAYTQYENQQFEGRVTIPLKFYIGYPIHEMPANITDGSLLEKQAAFFEYAKFDKASCQNIDQCNKASTFGSYLVREYQSQY